MNIFIFMVCLRLQFRFDNPVSIQWFYLRNDIFVRTKQKFYQPIHIAVLRNRNNDIRSENSFRSICRYCIKISLLSTFFKWLFSYKNRNRIFAFGIASNGVRWTVCWPRVSVVSQVAIQEFHVVIVSSTHTQ